MDRLRFDKAFQKWVVSIFLIFLAVMIAYDFAVNFLNAYIDISMESRFSAILTVTVPIFTFLLGMGTQVGSNKE